LVGRRNVINIHAPAVDAPVIYHTVAQNKYSHTVSSQLVIVVSFVVCLAGMESACMNPPEDDVQGTYQAVAQKMLTQQCS